MDEEHDTTKEELKLFNQVMLEVRSNSEKYLDAGNPLIIHGPTFGGKVTCNNNRL